MANFDIFDGITDIEVTEYRSLHAIGTYIETSSTYICTLFEPVESPDEANVTSVVLDKRSPDVIVEQDSRLPHNLVVRYEITAELPSDTASGSGEEFKTGYFYFLNS